MSKLGAIYVIMVGGIGARLRPYTYALPKPLLTANGISPLEKTINNILEENISNKIHLVVRYKKEIFRKWIKSKNIKNVIFVSEIKPLGTAGSLKKLLKKNFKNIILINGDLFFQTKFEKLINFHKDNNYEATVCTKKNITSIPYAILQKKNNKITFKEKPKIQHIINAGIYVLSRSFLKRFFSLNINKKREKFDMPELINFVTKKRLGIFDIGNKWIDIGNIYDYKKASREIKFW
jgi:NDP-sugar pyrophosphorylase family protein